jgi:HD superfamily phosphohydrolase
VRGKFEVIRDPLWNNIRLDNEALRLLDSEPFQRLRYVRQLGHAFLVYPGGSHSRFEHALGTYHLTRRVLTLLGERGETDSIPKDELRLATIAALLHDVGHYPFSHSLEEAGFPTHETLAAFWLNHPEIKKILEDTGIPDINDQVLRLITGESTLSLRGLISGSLDLDKIDYLTRDARMCGVPYGTVDVDRLIHSITMIDSEGGRMVGIHEKGVSALESLLFAKYQMYRNVYWHHAVRSATSMFKRLVRDAIKSEEVDVQQIGTCTDESLMGLLRETGNPLATRLARRRLYKRSVELPASRFDINYGDWISASPDLCETVEDQLALELGLKPGELLIDLPSKPSMLAADLPVLRRDSSTTRLGTPDGDELMGIQEIADQLHAKARKLRVFTARQTEIKPDWILERLEKP